MGYLKEIYDMQSSLGELYIKNTIVRRCIDSGKDKGIDVISTLTDMVIALVSHNEELESMLLKIQMEMPVQAVKLGDLKSPKPPHQQ